MSIGAWRAPLKLSAKLFVNSLYCVRTSHVQHVVLAASIALLPFVAQAGEPQPGTLIPAHVFAKPDKFADWEFAKTVWWELDTREKFDAEWNKYAPDFEAWLADYKQEPYKAMKALKAYPKDRRERILHGFDMQLAFDDWWNHTYANWRDGYEHHLRLGNAKTFDAHVKWARSRPCSHQDWISICGGPDWRTPAMKAEDQQIMAAAEAVIAKEKARREGKR